MGALSEEPSYCGRDCGERVGGERGVQKGVFSLQCKVYIAIVITLLASSCGLEEDYVVYAPSVVGHEPLYSNLDFAENYVFFTTNDSANDNPSFNYRGTAVYYKIYGSVSMLQSTVSAIDGANKSSSADAASMVIDTYGYVELNTRSGQYSPLIASNSSNQSVYIRLTSYQDTAVHPEYAPKVIIGYTGDKTAAASFVPVRNAGGKKYHFDFGRSNAAKYGSYAEDAKVPETGDVDVAGSSSNGKWYVDMYAIGVGNDATFTKYYSSVLHLGTIPIDANNEDN